MLASLEIRSQDTANEETRTKVNVRKESGGNFDDLHTNGTLPKPTKSIGNEVKLWKTVTHFTKLQWQWGDLRNETYLYTWICQVSSFIAYSQPFSIVTRAIRPERNAPMNITFNQAQPSFHPMPVFPMWFTQRSLITVCGFERRKIKLILRLRTQQVLRLWPQASIFFVLFCSEFVSK